MKLSEHLQKYTKEELIKLYVGLYAETRKKQLEEQKRLEEAKNTFDGSVPQALLEVLTKGGDLHDRK